MHPSSFFGARSTTNAAQLAVSTSMHMGKCWLLHPRSFFNIEIACRDDIQTNAGRRPDVWRWCRTTCGESGSGCRGNREGAVDVLSLFLAKLRAAFLRLGLEIQHEANLIGQRSSNTHLHEQNASCSETPKGCLVRAAHSLLHTQARPSAVGSHNFRLCAYALELICCL